MAPYPKKRGEREPVKPRLDGVLGPSLRLVFEQFRFLYDKVSLKVFEETLAKMNM